MAFGGIEPWADSSTDHSFGHLVAGLAGALGCSGRLSDFQACRLLL